MTLLWAQGEMQGDPNFMAALTGGELARPVSELAGIGPALCADLARLGIVSVDDLLFHVPRDYADRRTFTKIAEVREGDEVTVRGAMQSARSIRMRGRMSMAEVTFTDGTNTIKATWFGRGFLAKSFVKGQQVILSGRVKSYKGLAMQNPDYEVLDEGEDDTLHTGRIVPLYRLTEGVSQRRMRMLVNAALGDFAGEIVDPLPVTLRTRHGFPPLGTAIRAAHFPETLEAATAARRRFAYVELLELQIEVFQARRIQRERVTGIRHRVSSGLIKRLHGALPFTLTRGQQRAVSDIFTDMADARPMSRLLQGDVGCGKTVVALHGIAVAVHGGYQAAVMAPTEVLAEQHFATMSRYLQELEVSATLLTGSTANSAAVRAGIAAGEYAVVIGTHALIQDTTLFKRLGLVVIDEQHRFGVAQRSRLAGKGEAPDVLHMTATPIPRTMAMTVYGGMDLTIIDESPPGRLPVKTRYITASKLKGMYGFIVDEAAKGRQTYIICPLVEESDVRELRAVETHFTELSSGPLASLETALIHGRMASAEKEAVMARFSAGKADVLFSTTVIEVGVDVPNATTMVIEDAGQFGLTQLHQLRGRVGRSSEQSHCLLVGKPKTPEANARIEILCSTSSGFEIAEKDFEMRGPGEYYGMRQAGMTDFRVADLLRDRDLLVLAREDARAIIAEDPELRSAEWRSLAGAGAVRAATA